MQRVSSLLKEEHYLGAGRQIGRTLVQIVHHRERWAAILIWGPAAMKLIDRDEWIGWTHHQRAERLGLIVQNRRAGSPRSPRLQPISTLHTLICMGLLAGRKSLASIHRYGQFLTP